MSESTGAGGQPCAPDSEEFQRHLKQVRQLLARHRLVENLVHRQAMPRHELVETLVHSRNLSELSLKLDSLAAGEVAGILEALAPDERLTVWDIVKTTRGDAILRGLTAEVRAALAGERGTRGRKIMLNAFELHNGRLRQVAVDSPEDLTKTNPIWVDLVEPSEEERKWVGEHFGLELPDPADLTDLEASARHYLDDDGDLHLHSDFLLDDPEGARNVAVALILHNDILFSVRGEELPVFRLQRLRARILPGYVTDGKDVLLDLYAADAEYSADALEDVYAALEAVGRQVLSTRMTDEEAAKILAAIAAEEDLNGRIRRNVLDTRRAVSFLMRGKFLSPQQFDDARQILRDIESLDGHTGFLFGKINFLMDATVGFININQNKIIKIFSVASVGLLPPTLIASIYGMNFQFMPELNWQLGYPFSLALMAASVALPFLYFRRKGWLR